MIYQLTTRELTEVFQGLMALGGYMRVPKEGPAVRVPYGFEMTVERIIFRNLKTIKPEVEAFNEASRKRFLTISEGRDRLDGDKSEEDAKLLAKYNGEQNDEMSKKIEVILTPLHEAVLLKAGVPGTDMMLLAPIIEEEKEAKSDKPEGKITAKPESKVAAATEE